MKKEREKKAKNLEVRRHYNDFVAQIEVNDILLISTKVDNLSAIEPPSKSHIAMRLKAWYENKEGAFNAFERYSLTIKDVEKKTIAVKLCVVFCVTYFSKIPMTDELFDIFEVINLPLNTWPYFREFTQDTCARMGWIGIVAPVYRLSRPRV